MVGCANQFRPVLRVTTAMRSGQADGMFIDVVMAAQLNVQHAGKVIFNFGDVVKNYHIEVIYASM